MGHNEERLCSRCRNYPARSDRKTCQRCADGKVGYMRDYYVRKDLAASRKKAADEANAAGLCARCGAAAKPGRLQCGGCRAKRNAQVAARNDRRRARGVCLKCDNPPVAGRDHCETHLRAFRGHNRRLKDEGRCPRCRGPARPGGGACQSCLVEHNADQKARGDALKREVMGRYGGVFCACCGLAEIVVLTIDHINGGGNRHRKEVSKGFSGRNFYRWLKANDYPPGYQVLCYCCNVARHHLGRCYHEESRDVQMVPICRRPGHGICLHRSYPIARAADGGDQGSGIQGRPGHV